MTTSECGEEKAMRQCWDCFKRRLVCDRTLPCCKKCTKAGKECLGYDEQKPLQWVQTGKVTSRRRKKDGPAVVYNTPSKITAVLDSEGFEKKSASNPDGIPLEHVTRSQFFSEFTASTDYEWSHLDDDYKKHTLEEYGSHHAIAAEVFDTISLIGGKEQIEKVVSSGRKGQVSQTRREVELSRSTKRKKKDSKLAHSNEDRLAQLERVLRFMNKCDVPHYAYLANDTSEVVQAVHYFNVRIYPAVKRFGELVPNHAITNFPLAVLHLLPPTVHHIMVCLTVNHFIHSLPPGTDKAVTIVNRSKVYQHRGAAIRALSEYIGKDKTRCSDLSIASIMMFMSLELQNPVIVDWRAHAGGMKQLIELRGGLKHLMDTSPYIVPTLVVYVLVVVTANTCSPSWDQIPLSDTPEQNLADVKEIYNLMFPYTLCPPTLFFATFQVSQLRKTVSAMFSSGDMDDGNSLAAHDLLTEIESFSPADWAQPGENYNDWLLIGTIYQSAVALYCIMAFQSLTTLPNSLETNAMRCIYGDRLLYSLKLAVNSPRLTYFLMWPLTVAGAEAGYRDAATQYWIGKQMSELSRGLGSSSPLKAHAVLRRYWQKGEAGWDECFDRPETVLVPWMGC